MGNWHGNRLRDRDWMGHRMWHVHWMGHWHWHWTGYAHGNSLGDDNRDRMRYRDRNRAFHLDGYGMRHRHGHLANHWNGMGHRHRYWYEAIHDGTVHVMDRTVMMMMSYIDAKAGCVDSMTVRYVSSDVSTSVADYVVDNVSMAVPVPMPEPVSMSVSVINGTWCEAAMQEAAFVVFLLVGRIRIANNSRDE